MEESPAYRLNHEEVIKALEEGISFIEGLEPEEAVPDEHGKLKAVRFLRGGSGEVVELPARTCLVAAGTTPNITYAKEFPDALPLDAEAALLRARTAPSPDGDGCRLEPAPADDEARLLHRLLPRRQVRHVLRRQPPRLQRQRRQGDGLGPERLSARSPRSSTARAPRRGAPTPSGTPSAGALEDDLTARGRRGQPPDARRSSRSSSARPAAARNFQPGQFFRLQNLEAHAPRARRLAPAASSPAR